MDRFTLKVIKQHALITLGMFIALAVMGYFTNHSTQTALFAPILGWFMREHSEVSNRIADDHTSVPDQQALAFWTWKRIYLIAWGVPVIVAVTCYTVVGLAFGVW